MVLFAIYTNTLINNNHLFRFVQPRIFEAMACGVLVLSDRLYDVEKVGLVDGENIIFYNDLYDMQRLIKYYLSHNDERESIAYEGKKLVRQRHSTYIRAIEFGEIIRHEKR